MPEVVFKSRKFEQDGFTIEVKHVFDEDKQCETPEDAASNYSGESSEDLAKYFVQDQARYDSWTRDEWSYIGIVVEIRKQTTSNWANGGFVVGRSSVWGTEDDSEESYLESLEDDEITEAWAEVEKLKAALGVTA